MHALIMHHEGTFKGQSDARVLGGGAEGAWLDAANVISSFQSARGSLEGDTGGDADAPTPASAPDYTALTRLLRLLAKLSENQANAATIGDGLDFVPLAKEYIGMRHLKEEPSSPATTDDTTLPEEPPEPEKLPEQPKGKKRKRERKEEEKEEESQGRR